MVLLLGIDRDCEGRMKVLLKYCNFGRYFIVFLLYSSFGDVIPQFGDVLDVIGHVKVMM